MKPQSFDHNGKNLIIRNMTRGELDIAVAWAAQEGWNPGLHDAEAFWAADPEGYFVAELGGEVVASISAVAYDESFGFMGFYIVKPGYRDQGIGIRLFHAARDYLGNRNTGGDGVVERLEDYAREGLFDAYRNIRYEGIGTQESFEKVSDIADISFSDLLAYDRQMFPADRENFLRHWVVQPEGAALCALHDGCMAGYGVIRACHTGYKIAPLFADSPEIADNLFKALSSKAAGNPIFLDIPMPNSAALLLAKRHNMKPVFETGRIYSSTPPKLPLDRIFGVTSFELG